MQQNTYIRWSLTETILIIVNGKGMNSCNKYSALVQRTLGLGAGPSAWGRRSRFGDRRHWYPEFDLKSRQHLFWSQDDSGGIKGPVIQDENYEGLGSSNLVPISSSQACFHRNNHTNASYIKLQLRIGDWQNFPFHLDDSTSHRNSYCGPPKEEGWETVYLKRCIF